MFNSTITENEDFLCPADGSIMITGERVISFVIQNVIRLNGLIEPSEINVPRGPQSPWLTFQFFINSTLVWLTKLPLTSFYSFSFIFNTSLLKGIIHACYLFAASHLPYNRNGFKFFTNAGGLGKPDIKDILERAASIYGTFTDEDLSNVERKASQSIKQVDYMSIYTSNLVAAVRKAAGDIGKTLLFYL